MTPSLSPVRDRRPLSLSVTEAAPAPGTEHAAPEPTLLPWWAAALGGGVVASAVGWMVPTAVVLLGWLADMVGSMGLPLGTATQFWFAAHGGGASVGSSTWTMIPLGLTLLQLVIVSGVAAFAVRQRRGGGGPGRAAGQVTAMVSLGYVVPLVAAALLLGSPDQVARCLLGGVLVAAPAAWCGAARAGGVRWLGRLPLWLRPLPAAVAAGTVAMMLVGSVALVVAVLLGLDHVRSLSQAASTEPLATAVLVVAQLAYLPNLVLWTVSYALGAGFSVGTDSLVSPMVTELGLLPGFPVLGALPAEGIAGRSHSCWLASGVLAGALAAAVMVCSVHRRRPALRPDAAAVVGALAGVSTGLAVTALAALSRGSFGTGRLVGLGPRLSELVVMSVTLMGLAGLLAGLGIGLWGWRRRGSGRNEQTVSLEHSAAAVRAVSADRAERTVVLRRER